MLQGIAYKILQCKADAEDIVQDTFLKWLSVDQAHIKNTKAYLINAVINNCINHLNTLKRKKESYFDNINIQDFLSWFSEPDFLQFDLQTEISEAFSLIQTKLEPLERAVFLLKEVFDFDYDTLQEVLDKRKDHCRQLFSRARRKLFQETDKINFNLPNTNELFKSFKNACDLGNPNDFINELKNDISGALKKSF